MVMIPANKTDKNLDLFLWVTNPRLKWFIVQIAVLDITNTHKLQL